MSSEYAQLAESPKPRREIRLMAPPRPISTPMNWRGITTLRNTNKPIRRVNNGVSALSIPAIPESRYCWEVVKSTAGIPLPTSPTTLRYFQSEMLSLRKNLRETGKRTNAAMPMRSPATWAGRSTAAPDSSRKAFFMRIKELPQVSANNRSASKCWIRAPFNVVKIMLRN